VIPALEVASLGVVFASDRGPITAVEDVSLRVAKGRTLCVVGESGSGKSVSILATMGLLDPRRTTIAARTLQLAGVNLLDMPASQRRALNGDRLAMVFQDPMTSLNPYLRIGLQLSEVLEVHRQLPRRQAEQQAIAMLTAVGISAPEQRMQAYPHELSGGMRQRVVLAMALLCQPDVLLADEPTTALDVTIQAQVLKLIQDQQARTGMAVVLVTHDMGVVAHMADDVAVLYGGLVVERAPVDELFTAPKHPYTRALLASIPSTERRQRLHAIAGTPPSPQSRPRGCVFAPRCEFAEARCVMARPPEETLENGRTVRCIRHAELDLRVAHD
jgi:oligopeptide/dipeptide ABC transporter ATP-binding protein